MRLNATDLARLGPTIVSITLLLIVSSCSKPPQPVQKLPSGDAQQKDTPSAPNQDAKPAENTERHGGDGGKIGKAGGTPAGRDSMRRELAAVQANYEELRHRYEDLLARTMEASISSNFERHDSELQRLERLSADLREKAGSNAPGLSYLPLIGIYVGLLTWIGIAVLSAATGVSRGGDRYFWFAVGLLIGPLGLAMAFAKGDYCPECCQRISTKAAICPYCATRLTEPPLVTVEGSSVNTDQDGAA